MRTIRKTVLGGTGSPSEAWALGRGALYIGSWSEVLLSRTCRAAKGNGCGAAHSSVLAAINPAV